MSACCILHNMILKFDARMEWENDVNWGGLDGLHDVEEISDEGGVDIPNGNNLEYHLLNDDGLMFRIRRTVAPTDDFSHCGRSGNNEDYEDEVVEDDVLHGQLQKQLVTHFYFLYLRGQTRWQ